MCTMTLNKNQPILPTCGIGRRQSLTWKGLAADPQDKEPSARSELAVIQPIFFTLASRQRADFDQSS